MNHFHARKPSYIDVSKFVTKRLCFSQVYMYSCWSPLPQRQTGSIKYIS